MSIMKKALVLMPILVVIIGLTLTQASLAKPEPPEPPEAPTAPVPPAEPIQPEALNRKIVVFKSGVLNEPARDALLRNFDGVKIKDLTLINGKAVILPPKAQVELARHPGVLRIDDDVAVFALAQVLPWGIDKIDAEKVWPENGNTADSIKLAVVDTGISTSHPDLANNIKGGFSAVNYTRSFNDDNGHGSHVAGIAAALDNTTGVVGTGPQIDLYAIKVLDRRGSGYLSDIIEGLEWAIANNVNVVNMSLGTASNVQSFHDAVKAVYNAGIVQVAAAGNNGGAVIFPAAYPEVIAVSATDKGNNIASWSSRGPEIDLAAPGVSIYSTYKGKTYKTLSGTSMAAPHVAGSAALVLNTPITTAYDNDSDGIWDPIEVQKKLQDTAIDLNGAGFDNLYGWGLVNAYNAVQ